MFRDSPLDKRELSNQEEGNKQKYSDKLNSILKKNLSTVFIQYCFPLLNETLSFERASFLTVGTCKLILNCVAI